MISIIAATDTNGLIGAKNDLPWGRSLPADLKHFKEITNGKPVIMGSNTFRSIGRPLPNRTNIVLVKNPAELNREDIILAQSLSDAIEKAKATGAEETMIIGGASVYAQALPLADRLYITLVHHAFEGDTYFPTIDNNDWTITDETSRPADEKNLFDLTFRIYERKI